MIDCIFCKIVSREIPARIIYEDDNHIAFLTPFPNTDGFTVVATKSHSASYIFDLDNNEYIELLHFAKKIGKMLDKALGTKRTGLIMEGMGIDHAHVKLIPLHGIESDQWEAINSNYPKFYKKYPGYIASHDGPKQSQEAQDKIHQQILASISANTP